MSHLPCSEYQEQTPSNLVRPELLESLLFRLKNASKPEFPHHKPQGEHIFHETLNPLLRNPAFIDPQ